MAGQTATTDTDGKDISGNFEAQTRRVFSLMDQTLRRTGGTLASLVTMTVFIKTRAMAIASCRSVERCSGRQFSGERAHHRVELRRPGMEIEIQGIAVVGDKCTNGSCSTK